jgi:FG-GAP-like repeat
MRRAGTLAALGASAVLAAAGTAWAAFTPEGSPYATGGAAPYDVDVADFNADGRPDVAAMNGDSGTVSVFLRQPGGGFTQESGSPFTVGGGLSNQVVGDFNGDGRPDIATGGFTTGVVSVLLRQAAGGFVAEGQGTTLGARVGAVAAGDFNGDGKLDLAATQWDNGQLTILLRNSTNDGFTPGRTAATGANPRAIAVGNFDGTGGLDLAVTNNNNNGAGSVTILLGAGDGSFAVGGTVPVGTAPNGIVAADVTGDGRTDLAVANSGSSTVSILAGNGAGGFADEAGSPIAVSTTPIGLAVTDVDADGRPDVAVATYANAVDILRRNAGGGFTRDPSIPVTGQQSGIATGDFDGDGRADLAVSEITNSTFSVLLNPAPVQPTPTPTPTATPLPPPVAGKTVNAARKAGKVSFRPPGGKTFVALTAAAQIPVGSVIDTRKGTIAITAAQGKGKTASADFFDGLFKLTQTKGSKPATTLALTEKLSCPRRGKASAAAKRKKTRRLWGSGHGRFTTKGSYSAATVRGTKWLVQDTCTTTLTKVTRGVVSVRDFAKRRTKLVRAGHRYVARKR